MTLYSKWSTGKNIMFLSGLVMLICIFIPWNTHSEYNSYFDSFSSLLGNNDWLPKDWNNARTMSNLRWLMLIPMAYPVFCLFTEKYLKNVCCISALVAVLYPILALILGFKYINAAAWIFMVAAIVFFLGTTMANPAAAAPAGTAGYVPPVMPQPPVTPVQPVVPPQPAGEIFCPQCGQKNSADAKFCAKCGRPMQ
jgi:hypothetical protein